MNMPFVSVIIPVYNDAERLRKCLDALDGQSYPKSRYEVIVVDNNSEQDISAVVSIGVQARITSEHQPSSYSARNKGISVSQGEILAFTDADCIPRADWVEKGVAALRSVPNCGLVAGEIKVFCKDPDSPTAVETYDRIRGFEQKIFLEEKHFGATANMFTFKKVFDDVGLFNCALKSGGDKEWGERVYAAGYGQIFAEEALVAHPARYSMRDLFRKISRITLNRESSRRDLKKILGTYYRNMVPPIGEIASAWQDPRLIGVRQKLQYSCILIFVRFVRIAEQTRMLLGGGQQRS